MYIFGRRHENASCRGISPFPGEIETLVGASPFLSRSPWRTNDSQSIGREGGLERGTSQGVGPRATRLKFGRDHARLPWCTRAGRPADSVLCVRAARDTTRRVNKCVLSRAFPADVVGVDPVITGHPHRVYSACGPVSALQGLPCRRGRRRPGDCRAPTPSLFSVRTGAGSAETSLQRRSASTR